MNYIELAEILFPEITLTMDDYEKLYPERNLPEGAKVTRIAPSPTGFMHLGNLFGAVTDERLAHLSDGVFYLRIEDTDLKRQVEGGVETIIKVFDKFGLKFDEGVTLDGEKGDYGPYRQRQREKIYKTYAKHLVKEGLAYPCFATEEELEEMRKEQEAKKENFGYYGKYAKYREYPLNEAAERVKDIAAPANATRLGCDTPCTKVGHCMNCASQRRICATTVICARQRVQNRIKVILVGEELGY